jgi:hypothetical protein
MQIYQSSGLFMALVCFCLAAREMQIGQNERSFFAGSMRNADWFANEKLLYGDLREGNADSIWFVRVKYGRMNC